MPGTALATYMQLADDTASRLTYSHQEWTCFLKTAARLYKYPYHEQLMIYAQRPGATACADFELWNKKMRRYVRRGSKGIALVDTTGNQPKLRYVFDVADTGKRENSLEFSPWAISEENAQAAELALEKGYDAPARQGLVRQIHTVSHQLSQLYCIDHRREIGAIVDGSYLDGYDEVNVGAAFRKAASVSLEYALLSRCGLNPDERFIHEDFLPIFDWNTPEAVAVLGTAVSEMSEEVLRTIEISIRNHERSLEHERDQLHSERRPSDSRPDPARDEAPHQQVRKDAQDVSTEKPSNIVQFPRPDGQAVSAPAGDRGRGGQTPGAAHGRAGEAERRDGGAESLRSDEMGRDDEQPESAGRGSHPERADLQLNAPVRADVQLSFFPTEETQIAYIDRAESTTPSAPVFVPHFSLEEIDRVLIQGTNEQASRYHILMEYQKSKALSEIAAMLPHAFVGGKGFETDQGNMCAWYGEDGIHLTRGSTARYALSAQVIPWEAAAERIYELLDLGQYATYEEIAFVPSFEQKELAQGLWYMRQDLDEKGADCLTTIGQLYAGYSYDEGTANIAALLEQPESRIALTEEVRAFAQAYEQDHSLLRFHFHKPLDILRRMEELGLPRRDYESVVSEFPQETGFITQDEIDGALSERYVYSNGNLTIHAFFQDNPTQAEKVAFIKKHYGIGGCSHALFGASGSWMEYNGKGMRFRKEGCADASLSWTQVTKRIGDLITRGRYLNEETITTAAMMSHRYEVVVYHHFENGFNEKREYQNLQDAENAAQGYVDGTLEDDGFAYDGAAIYDLRERQYVRIFGDFPDDNAHADVLEAAIDNNHTASQSMPERDDFSHESSVQQPVPTQSVFTFAVGDTVYLEDGKAFIVEEVSDIGIQLRDPTLLYPIWRNESKESFSHLLRRYPQTEQPERDIQESTQPQTRLETVEVYPAEQNNLPYDVIIERMHPDELVQEQVADILPCSENFRITDDHLGVGGVKTKYGWNVEAIRTLQTIEAKSCQATPEEQKILSRYVGWGGIPQAFDESNAAWSKEYSELKGLLPDAEYASARASTLNAHYTSPTVIHAIYETIGRMGFTTGNVLEPACGVGNFLGLLPESMAGSNLYGVELDSITGRIAQQLYPQAHITVQGFEKTDRRDFYDLAVGNVPFGNYRVSDKAYDKLGFHIHDYFFAKSLDQVRPGGMIAFITSKGTMDKQSPEVRRYIAQRAELLGAVRLPNDAFKANAGTEVTTDILFLQKKDRPIDVEPDWVHLGMTEDGIPVNSYFIDHPEMLLGKMARDDSMYGNRQETACLPIKGAVLSEQLAAAMQHITGQITEVELPDMGEGVDTSLPADPNVRNFSYTLVSGEIYYRENSRMVRPDLTQTAQERVKGLVELRDCVRELIDQQMDNASDEIIRRSQATLSSLYDDFTAKYGLINNRGNANAFADDSSYYLLCSLELLDENRNLAGKADMFTKRTIRPAQAVEHVDTASEALAVSIAERARVDMPYMAMLSGKTEDELASELRGVIFRLPAPVDTDEQPSYVAADEYLSGNIREKLGIARKALEVSDLFAPNVTALEQAMPRPLEASEIDVRLGATWIDKSYIQSFLDETFDPPFYSRNAIKVNFSTATAEWNIASKGSIPYDNVAAYTTYGTTRASAYRILEDALNLRDVRVYDTVLDADGREKRVLNKNETTLAQQKQQAIKDAFRDWVWRDANRRQVLVERYNVLFNSTRPREYSGEHITFSGMNPEISLRPHQTDAIAHILYGGNTLLAHEVGAGKTFEMVAAVMESKRLGLCQKALFAVPNHLTEQWASEFLRLYPSSNILVATKKDFETKSRKKFCARIATGDYDAIIMGHSQFEKIPVSQERQERLLKEQIGEIEEGITEMKASHAERFTIKQMEHTKKQLEAKLKRLTDTEHKDDVVTFEQLGVDRLYVDEAHGFKNLFLYTKMRNVAGLSTSEAQKSSDMLMKCRYLDEITGGRGVVFATGTPVSNSMTELFTMMRYLQHDTLRYKGLSHFDCWASTFGETTTAIELAPEGTGYRARTRFAKFFNLPELMTMFKEAADIKTADQLHLPTPEPVYHNVVAQPTEIQKGMVQELSERAAAVHSGKVDASVDNMLKVTSDGRKLGLDQRIINPLLPDDPQSKVNLCVDNIRQIWRDGSADKLTQLVFCDISTPKEDGSFNIYDDIRRKLIAKGIPESEIAFIHEANTEVKKKELFAKVRTGQVRVLMGSTSKMGAGTNVQDRLVALHDVDCPWRPGDLEQRKGRIVRQGNRNAQVHIYRYVTEGTFDSYLWQTVENKQKFISQIMTSKSPVRSCEDVDQTALSYAEIKALCAGNPLIKAKMDLDVEVSRLRLLKASHQSQKYRMEDRLLKYFPEQIERTQGCITGFQADITLAEKTIPQKGEFAGMEVLGRVCSEKESAGTAIINACKAVKDMQSIPLGRYRGFAMSLSVENFGKDYMLTLKGTMSHKVALGSDPRGNILRIDHALEMISERLSQAQSELDNLCHQRDAAKMEIEKPFPQEVELQEKSARLAELDTALNMEARPAAEPICEEGDAELPGNPDKPSIQARLAKAQEETMPSTERKQHNYEEVR